jgi:heme-degrading monooxygenase HmoA
MKLTVVCYHGIVMPHLPARLSYPLTAALGRRNVAQQPSVCEATMIIERAELPVTSGREVEFEEAFIPAAGYLRGAKDCHGVSFARGIENPSRYLLLIEWESLAAHQAFAATEEFGKFVAVIRPFLAGKPDTQHFGPVHRR